MLAEKLSDLLDNLQSILIALPDNQQDFNPGEQMLELKANVESRLKSCRTYTKQHLQSKLAITKFIKAWEHFDKLVEKLIAEDLDQELDSFSKACDDALSALFDRESEFNRKLDNILLIAGYYQQLVFVLEPYKNKRLDVDALAKCQKISSDIQDLENEAINEFQEMLKPLNQEIEILGLATQIDDLRDVFYEAEDDEQVAMELIKVFQEKILADLTKPVTVEDVIWDDPETLMEKLVDDPEFRLQFVLNCWKQTPYETLILLMPAITYGVQTYLEQHEIYNECYSANHNTLPDQTGYLIVSGFGIDHELELYQAIEKVADAFLAPIKPDLNMTRIEFQSIIEFFLDDEDSIIVSVQELQSNINKERQLYQQQIETDVVAHTPNMI